MADRQSKKEVEKFVKSQRSIHLYKKLQRSLRDVLLVLPKDTYKKITKNLIVMSLHLTAVGQAMFFPDPKGNFKIVEFIYDENMPVDVMRYYVAHELGHIYNGYLFPKKGETWGMLEKRADKHAAGWGFPRTKQINYWMSKKHMRYIK